MKLRAWYWVLYGLLSYDILLLFLPYHELLEEEIQIADLQAGMKIFDAGCGTGNLIWRVLKRYSNLEIVGGDFAKPLIWIAKLKTNLSKFSKNNQIIFLEVDLNHKLMFPDKSFDRIICSNVLYALDNPYETLKEFNRILKPGGKLVLLNPVKGYRENAPFVDHMKRASIPKKILLLVFIPILIFLKLFNVVNRRNRNWHFYQNYELVQKVKDAGFIVRESKSTYSGIGTLIVGERR